MIKAKVKNSVSLFLIYGKKRKPSAIKHGSSIVFARDFQPGKKFN